MAKARKKKVRKPAKRAAKKRKVAARAKTRKPVKAKARRRAKPRKQKGFVEALADAAREAGLLRNRLAGRNTFED